MKAESSRRVLPSADALPTVANTTAFQVGKIVTDPYTAAYQDASIIGAFGEKEESYIPVQLARESLQRVVDDMHEMKARQQEKLQAIMERYASIEAATKQHYEAFVLDVKRRALERVQIQKQQYAQLRVESENDRKANVQRIESLEASAREQSQLQVQMLAMYQAERETHLFSQASELQTLKKAYDAEQQRLRQDWAAKTDKLHHTNNELSMRIEDQTMLYRDVEAKLHSMEAHVSSCVADAAHQLQSFREESAIELSVNRIVSDLCWQVVLLHKPFAQDQATVTETPRGLETPPDLTIKAFESQCTQTMEQQIEDEAVALRAALENAKSCEQRLRDELEAASAKQKACERQILEDIVEQLVLTIALEHVQVPFRSFEDLFIVEQIPPEYDHLIACELEMEALRDSADALKAQASDLHHKKTASKQAIKDWLASFEAANHREPTIQDKAQVALHGLVRAWTIVKDMYITFKQVEEQYNLAREKLNDQKKAYNAKLAEVETLQSSQTMQSFPHHTLVLILPLFINPCSFRENLKQLFTSRQRLPSMNKGNEFCRPGHGPLSLPRWNCSVKSMN
ncbi:hypothetical protein ACHHYP_09674 [Achlya hypogyna]|uniref:Uncharacterized protein n=1 Tax=Achlya hypogyna TaxID=1202772 RepID=A0A1V9ZIU5_ACHHY|nr:hypothetical protein ACHHYP_09674 [Achlya hypogyna]